MELHSDLYKNRFDNDGKPLAWDTRSVHELVSSAGTSGSLRTTERALEKSNLIPPSLTPDQVEDEYGRPPRLKVLQHLEQEARRKRQVTLVLQEYRNDRGQLVLFSNDLRGGRKWVYLDGEGQPGQLEQLREALSVLVGNRLALIIPSGAVTARLRKLQTLMPHEAAGISDGQNIQLALPAFHEPAIELRWDQPLARQPQAVLSNLDRLEADSIFILREVAAQARNPAMLFSLGKDSCVMLHLARKAFYPGRPPFPLIHVDTRWKFRAMYDFRDQIARDSGMDMIIHVNPDAVEKDINPFDHGSELHTHVTKTEGLKQVLDKYQIDMALGGARRDEEKSRAKERVFSVRNSSHRWDPKRQRPELWDLYNGYKDKTESIRAFPLSDWTELDVWQYILREQIPIIPLYFAANRPVVNRDGQLMMVDDDRLELFSNEKIEIRKVRFRTLGCYPLTGAIESEAEDLPGIIMELMQSRTSERQGRVIDKDSEASMEKKKLEGYF